MPLGRDREDNLFGLSLPPKLESVGGATATQWNAKGVTNVLTASTRQLKVARCGRRQGTLWPVSRRLASTELLTREPPIATSIPSWRKVFANGMG